MNLWEYVGKNVRCTLVGGEIISGLADLYTSAMDNTGEVHTGVETICIDDTELSADEIDVLEVL